MLVKVPVILCQQTELGLHQELITLQIQMSTITMAIRLDSNQPEEHNQTTTQRPSPHLSGPFNEGNGAHARGGRPQIPNRAIQL